MKSIGEDMSRINPDLIFLSTPHGHSLSNSYAIYGNDRAKGTAEWDGEWQEFTAEVNLNSDSSKNLSEFLQKEGFSVEMMTAFTKTAHIQLRWGEVIPLWFLNSEQQSPSRKHIIMCIPSKRLTQSVEMASELVSMGEKLFEFFDGMKERVAVVISGDLAHSHDHNFPNHPKPYPTSESAVPFDILIQKWVVSHNLETLQVEAGHLVNKVLSCGYTGFLLLHGILKNTKLKGKVLAIEHPTYYGMMVASFCNDSSFNL